MTEERKILFIADVIEQKVRKEKELDFYLQELEELQRKIGYLRREVDLTNTIIDMIKSEQVYDIKEGLLERHNDKLLQKNPEKE
jgi:hypothetical protein